MTLCKLKIRRFGSLFCKYILPSLLSLFISLYIFYMQIENIREERVKEYKISKVDSFQATISGLDFDLSAQRKVGCGGIDERRKSLLEDRVDLIRSIDDLKRMLSKGSDIESYFGSEDTELIKSQITKGMRLLESMDNIKSGEEYIADLDQYRAVVVKGRIAALAVNDAAMYKIADDVKDLYLNTLSYDLKPGNDVCIEGTKSYKKYSNLIEDARDAVIDLELFKANRFN